MAGAAFVFVAVLLACKHTYTPPGSAMDAASDASVDYEVEASGACEPKVGNDKCLAGGRAAFCKPRLVHDGPRNTHWEGDWITFTCPDCRKADELAHIKCSDYVVGEPCSTFVADDICTPSKTGMYRCDPMTSAWTIEACAGGCTATYRVICKH